MAFYLVTLMLVSLLFTQIKCRIYVLENEFEDQNPYTRQTYGTINPIQRMISVDEQNSNRSKENALDNHSPIIFEEREPVTIDYSAKPKALWQVQPNRLDYFHPIVLSNQGNAVLNYNGRRMSPDSQISTPTSIDRKNVCPFADTLQVELPNGIVMPYLKFKTVSPYWPEDQKSNVRVILDNKIMSYRMFQENLQLFGFKDLDDTTDRSKTNGESRENQATNDYKSGTITNDKMYNATVDSSKNVRNASAENNSSKGAVAESIVRPVIIVNDNGSRTTENTSKTAAASPDNAYCVDANNASGDEKSIKNSNNNVETTKAFDPTTCAKKPRDNSAGTAAGSPSKTSGTGNDETLTKNDNVPDRVDSVAGSDGAKTIAGQTGKRRDDEWPVIENETGASRGAIATGNSNGDDSTARSEGKRSGVHDENGRTSKTADDVTSISGTGNGGRNVSGTNKAVGAGNRGENDGRTARRDNGASPVTAADRADRGFGRKRAGSCAGPQEIVDGRPTVAGTTAATGKATGVDDPKSADSAGSDERDNGDGTGTAKTLDGGPSADPNRLLCKTGSGKSVVYVNGIGTTRTDEAVSARNDTATMLSGKKNVGDSDGRVINIIVY